MSEKQLPILMACRLSVMYDVKQLRAVPDIPYHVDKRIMRMSWSMVSKAADMSREHVATSKCPSNTCEGEAIGAQNVTKSSRGCKDRETKL